MKKVHKIADYLFLYLNIVVVFFLFLNGNTFSVLDAHIEFNVLPIPFILFVLTSLFTSTFSLKSAFASWYFKGLLLLFFGYFISAIAFAESKFIWLAIENKLSFLTIPIVVFSNANFYQKKNKITICYIVFRLAFFLAYFGLSIVCHL